MNRFKELRLKNGFRSQQELATTLYVNQTAVSQWERGITTPSAPILLKLSQMYHVSTDYLLGKGVTVDSHEDRRGILVPVLGNVAAGIPIEAVEDILDYEEIDAATAATGEFFALRLKGASMEPRMRDGDVVIIRKQDDADTGDTVVVLVNGDCATVKRIKKGPPGISLIPNNPAYDIMFYSSDEVQQLPVKIIGKVVELRAKF
ncbi:MAG: XRE family transcriptional regulator [Lawsonibacter sp.]|nr:XRE family transcriptional regulator [Lawsonibacter sp.]